MSEACEIDLEPCHCPERKNKLGYRESFHNSADELTEAILGFFGKGKK